MQISVSTKELLRVLKAVNAVIPKKNSLPILGNTLFTQREEKFFLTGSSMENTLSMPVAFTLNNGDTFKPFCLDATQIMPLLSALPEQPLTLDVNDNTHTITIIYQGGKVSLPIEETEQYPRVADMTAPVVQFDIATNILLPAVKAASLSTGCDDLRPVLGAVCLDVTEEEVTFVGTDGQSLYKFVFTHGAPFLTAGGPDRILLPASVVNALMTPFAATETMTILHDGKHICVRHGDTTFTIRDIEGKYPNYNSVIPTNSPYHVTLPVRDLQATAKRVQLMSSDASNMVKLSKEGMFLYLSADDIDFSKSAREELTLAEVENPCTLPDGFAIGFKCSTLLRLLEAISTDNVRIEMTSPERAILIKEDAPNSALTELLMPMSLN